MRKILLLRNLSKSAGSDTQAIPDFFSQAAETTVELFEACFDDLVITVGDGTFSIFDAQNQHDLNEYSAIFIRGANGFDAVRDVALAVGYYGRLFHIDVFNDIEYSVQSKLAHAVRFEYLNIPVGKTVWVSKAVLEHPENLSIQFPCVMKASMSSLGKYNYKVKNFAEVKRRQAAHPNRRFVLQEFFAGDGDYRLLMVGSEKLLISYYNDPKASYSKLATEGIAAKIVPLSELPKRAVSDAEKIAAYQHMKLCGTDILVNHQTGRYTFLEVNAQPNLTNLDDPITEKIATFRRFFQK